MLKNVRRKLKKKGERKKLYRAREKEKKKSLGNCERNKFAL